jgi:predicted metal-binding membrane protein
VRLQLWPVLLTVSAAAFALSLAVERSWLLVPLCGSTLDFGAVSGGLRSALLLNPVAGLAAAWLIMLAAMMPPLLAAPIRHLLARSFAGRRVRTLALFLGGYVLVWSGAGLLIVPGALVLHGMGTFAPAAPAIAMAAAALAWQVSPAKQSCLNRCHRLRALAAFGARADRDALLFGIEQGCACAGACWALMALPLVAGGAHGAAMVPIGLFIFLERLEAPRRPQWRIAWPSRAGWRLYRALHGSILRHRPRIRAAS